MSADESEAPTRKRRRAAHACDVCRHRKIRCDGREPCATCVTSQQSCIYGAEASSRGKSDLILDGVLRVERYLHEMNSMIASNTQLISQRPPLPAVTPQSAHLTVFNGGSPHTNSGRSPGNNQANNDQTVNNAILSSLHTSTTESVLQWPHFNQFPSLRQNYSAIFDLEQSRTPLPSRNSEVIPYLNIEEVRQIIQSFQSSVNFFYPTMARGKLDAIQRKIIAGNLDNSVDSCLSLVVMALGCASQSVSSLFQNQLNAVDFDYQQSRRSLAEMYFDGVVKRLHNAHLAATTDATQCLFFSGLYFAYLQRPLQAWQYINTTAAKCRLLLEYSQHSTDSECVRRIFWSCYILESDYLAELAALPPSGIASIESSIPLPGDYNTHQSTAFQTPSPAFSSPRTPQPSLPEQEQELSSLYFLACISMRRLLNRVHDLLYAASTGASLDSARFPFIVKELSHQLEEWRDLLPAAFQFTIDTNPTRTPHGGFLRQRYLTCKSVIYRPYLTWVLNCWDGNRGGGDIITEFLNQGTRGITPNMIDKSAICLEAILLHILNLRGFAHTVLVDTWICSLSMAGGMLILLAASRILPLRERIGPEVTTLGSHLQSLISQWMHVPGDAISPSVEQSLRMICEVEGFLNNEFLGATNRAEDTGFQ